jgi:hypothetical protein
LFVMLLCSILPQVVHAQTPPCPTSSSSINFTFTPTAQGDSRTETINLAPCETIEVHESHDMGGDPNRGTLLRVSFLNSAQQEIVGQSIYGFSSATDNRFPAAYEEPFPFTGVRDANVLPATFKVEATYGVGYGNPPSPPQYNFTITSLLVRDTTSGVTTSPPLRSSLPSPPPTWEAFVLLILHPLPLLIAVNTSKCTCSADSQSLSPALLPKIHCTAVFSRLTFTTITKRSSHNW